MFYMKNIRNIAIVLITVSLITSCNDRTNASVNNGNDTTIVDTRRNTNTTSNFLDDTTGKVKIEDQHQNQ
jgi:hypothetical protein